MYPEGILVHFLTMLFPSGEKNKMFPVPEPELVFIHVSAAVCFVFVCKLCCFFLAGSCGGGDMKAAPVGCISLGALRGVTQTLVPGPKY